MARLLGTPERAHWKACEKSGEEEAAIAAAFKDKFKLGALLRTVPQSSELQYYAGMENTHEVR